MIFDAHCHAWARWPYQPPVPDPDSRGTVEQLLFEMDTHGVAQALIVCAELDDNPDNNAYAAEAVAAHPSRLRCVIDVDSRWKPTYHTPGASDRLIAAARQYSPVGFTHYLALDDDGAWLTGSDGMDFFAAAAGAGLIASIHGHPHQQAAIRVVARRFPAMPILIHHLGHPHAGEQADLDEILASAACPNIYMKISGFYYATARDPWDYPYADVQPIVRAIYAAYGARRMCWGSDYPVCRWFTTYRQALEMFRQGCAFIPEADQAQILGGTLAGLLGVG